MSICIKKILAFGQRIHPKLKQWLWFVGLWCLGFGTVLLITVPIKLLIRALK